MGSPPIYLHGFVAGGNHPTLGPELRLISHAMPMDLSYLGDVNHQVQQIYCDFNVSGGLFFYDC